MFGFPTRNEVESVKAEYPEGCRVELLSMSDPFTNIRKGTQGTVRKVDDIGSVHVNWDNGSSLAAVYGVDHISIVH